MSETRYGNMRILRFFILVFIVALIFAMINAVSGMGCAFILNYFEKMHFFYKKPLTGAKRYAIL